MPDARSRKAHRCDADARVDRAAARACAGCCCRPRNGWRRAAWADASRIASARLWPAQEYTRVIFESATPIEHQLVVLRDPDRARARPRAHRAIARARRALASRVQPADPYIAAIRVGQPAGGFLRVVLDLKAEIRPQVFALKPVAEFGHRLVHRPVSADAARSADGAARPRAAPTRRRLRRAATRTPARDAARSRAVGRRVAQDAVAAHHHRDRSRATAARIPARSGRRGTYEKNVVLAIARKLKQMLDADRHARDADAQRRLLRAARRARAEGAARAGGPVRVDPRRCVSRAVGARLVGVRAVRARRDERRGALARAARERGRPDRRRQPRRQRSGARAHAARPVADGADQRQPEGRPAGARRHRRRTTRCTRRPSSRRASPC